MYIIKQMKVKQQNHSSRLRNVVKYPQSNNLKDSNNKSSLDVMGMLDRQEETINALLNKYTDSSPQQQQMFAHHHQNRRQDIVKIKRNDHTDSYNYRGNNPRTSRSYSTMNLPLSDYSQQSINSKPSVMLPSVNQRVHPIDEQKPKKKRTKLKNQYSINFKKERQRNELQLYKIYGDRRQSLDNIPISSKSRSKSKNKNIGKPQSPLYTQSKVSLSVQVSKNTEREVDLPLGIPSTYRKLQQQLEDDVKEEVAIQSDDSDSQKSEQIGVSYYERDFRKVMKNQLLEEMNFLYFNKNSEKGGMDLKEWSYQLLSLFEKHDKELHGLRRKSRYLHTMDDKFFSAGIFSTDNI